MAEIEVEGSKDFEEQKIVKEYIAIQKLLEELFYEANEAEKNRTIRGVYLTRIYDELSEIARVKSSTNEEYNKLFKDWEELPDLSDPYERLESEDFRKRKRILSRVREQLGMGTSPPKQTRMLYPPLRLAEFHKRCKIPAGKKKGCEVKENLEEDRKKWQ